MITICKKCNKRYRIDESKLSQERSFFKCRQCNCTIEIVKPEELINAVPHEPKASIPSNKDTSGRGIFQVNEEKENSLTDTFEEARKEGREKGLKIRNINNMSVGKKLLFVFLIFILSTASILTFVYMMIVPTLIYDQINLRTYSISRAFSTSIQQPLLDRDYLLINKSAETNVKLPGVAYISVLNKKGDVVAGIFGDKEQFDPDFIEKTEEYGFPKEISERNGIPAGKSESALDFGVGGRKVHDVAVRVGDTGGVVHVGLFIEEIEKAVHKSLFPLLIFLIMITVIGCLSFFLVAQTISIPIRLLTLSAEKISFGDIDFPINVNCGGEIGELAASLERMRFSIKEAIARLRRASIKGKAALDMESYPAPQRRLNKGNSIDISK